MLGALKFENKPLTIRWYLLTTGYTTHVHVFSIVAIYVSHPFF